MRLDHVTTGWPAAGSTMLGTEVPLRRLDCVCSAVYPGDASGPSERHVVWLNSGRSSLLRMSASLNRRFRFTPAAIHQRWNWRLASPK
jgi:hypothetical protein